MTPFLWTMTGSFAMVAALFFLKFWRETRDAFFLLFGLAFTVLGLHFGMLALVHEDEHTPHQYILRLVAFVLIILAIVQKNRR